MDSPAIIFLSDAYGKKNIEHGGFVLCPLYGRKTKAFQAAAGTTNSAIIASLVCSMSDFNIIMIIFHKVTFSSKLPPMQRISVLLGCLNMPVS